VRLPPVRCARFFHEPVPDGDRHHDPAACAFLLEALDPADSLHGSSTASFRASSSTCLSCWKTGSAVARSVVCPEPVCKRPVTSNNADADAYQARSNATFAREEVGCELEPLAKEQAESGSPTSARIRGLHG
jgi:hypothetical protein